MSEKVNHEIGSTVQYRSMGQARILEMMTESLYYNQYRVRFLTGRYRDQVRVVWL